MARLGYERPLFSHFFWKGAWGRLPAALPAAPPNGVAACLAACRPAARRTARRTAEWRCRVPCRVPPHPQAPFPRAVRGSALYTEPQDPRGLPRSAVNFAWPGGQAILAKAPCFGVPRPPSGGRGRASSSPLSLWVRLFPVGPVAGALPALPGRLVRGAITSPVRLRGPSRGPLDSQPGAPTN